jgi:hypothetical protein
MKKYFLLMVEVLCLCLMFCVGAGVLNAANDGAIEILQKCAKNLDAADNVQYKANVEITYKPNPSADTNIRKIQSTVCKKGDAVDVRSKWIVHKGEKLLETYSVEDIITSKYALTKHIDPAEKNASNKVNIIAANKEKGKDRLATPILTGGYYGRQLDGFVGSKMRFTDMMLAESDRVEKVGEETINNFTCVQLKAATKYGLVNAWIDVNNGYVARKVVCIRNRDSVGSGGDKYLAKMPDVASFQHAVECLDFVKIGDSYVAAKGKSSCIRVDTDNTKYQDVTQIEREQIDLSPDFTGKNLFNTDHLKNEIVNNLDDQESGVVYIWDGEKSVPSYQIVDGEIILPRAGISIVRIVLILSGLALLLLAMFWMIRKKITLKK